MWGDKQSFENDVAEKYLIRWGRLVKKQIVKKHYIMIP